MKARDALVSVFSIVTLVACTVVDELQRWRGRRRVRAAIARETARHIDLLVPRQRQSPDPVWWEFVHQQDGGDR